MCANRLSTRAKGVKLYDLETKEVFCSRDVIFKETVFPFKEIIVTRSPSPVFNQPMWPCDEDENEVHQNTDPLQTNN